jgi:hypothetical protein
LGDELNPFPDSPLHSNFCGDEEVIDAVKRFYRDGEIQARFFRSVVLDGKPGYRNSGEKPG